MAYKEILIGLVYLSSIVKCQIPSFGGCPVYQPMANFEKDRFLGTWYEVERFFTITELASRCISVTYEKRADGKIWVNNAITNRFTNVQRIISGTMKLSGVGGEAKYNIHYTTLPVNYETTMIILDTDYKNYAVIWSCNGIGPVGHTESAWLMMRERRPPGPILQRAYGILDKYQISRTFFLKTDQNNCETVPPAQEAYDPTTEIPQDEVDENRKKSNYQPENNSTIVTDSLKTEVPSEDNKPNQV